MNTGWLIVFVLLNAADIYTTHTVLKQGGRELNPILAKLFEKADFTVVYGWLYAVPEGAAARLPVQLPGPEGWIAPGDHYSYSTGRKRVYMAGCW